MRGEYTTASRCWCRNVRVGVFNLAAAVSGGSAEGSGVVATPGCFTLAKVRFGVTNTPGCLSVHMVVSSVGPGIIGVSTPGFGVVASSRVVGSLLDSGGVVTPGYNLGVLKGQKLWIDQKRLVLW